MIKLSEFRHTRQLARAYRASQARQNVAHQRWREEGLEALTKEMVAAMDWWAERGQIRVYDRAVSPEWDWK